MNALRIAPRLWTGLVSCLLAGLLVAAPANAQSESCSSATVIGDGTFAGTTSGATNDGSASCGSSSTSADVWYSYTGTQNCQLTVDTCGSSFDTVLSIHSACPGTAANQIACNDDSCGLQSSISLSAVIGTTYLIRVAGYAGATGSFTMHTVCTVSNPAADSCANAIPVVPGTYTGTTASATNDGSASCGNSATSADVWYSYAATDHCRLRASLCGSTYDTVASIHAGCPGTTGNEISCNDDSCGLQSNATAVVDAGNTYYIRVAGYGGATGAFSLAVTCDAIIPGSGADAMVPELDGLQQLGRLGDIAGCAMQSTICNAGSLPLDWIANPDPRHPFIGSNLFRVQQGRIEQLGQSWVKHAFAAAQGDYCGLGCQPSGGALGVGCSDVYGAGLNGSPGYLGPRSEINPWTGAFTWIGSHLQRGGQTHNAIDHRMELHDADINPASNPGATYFAEMVVVAHDDVNHTNNNAWEPVTITGTPGGVWNFNLSGANSHVGTAIEAWAGSTRTVFPDLPVDDGRSVLAVKATDNGNGTWHYEYAIYNLDMDRGVGSFSLPVGDASQVTNAGFHAVPSDGEPYSNTAWTFTRNTDSIVWATDPYSQNPAANPIRWGTLFNFWFDADAAPAATTATLGLYRPGTPTELSGTTQGPTVPIPCNAGTVNLAAGPPEDVLLVNGSSGDPVTRVVNVAIGAPFTVSLAASSAGPSPARYGLWVWRGSPANPGNLVARGQTLGCTVNPTPIQHGQAPQPTYCVRGGLPAGVCTGATEITGPSRSPWSIPRSAGFPVRVTFTMQAVLEDAGAANTTGYSVTNAVVLATQ